jgi:signal peptidase I
MPSREDQDSQGIGIILNSGKSRFQIKRGTQFFAHTGRSMNPTLRAKDLLEIAAVEYGKIQKGDVIVFLSPTNSEMIAHRVSAISPNGICTKGDNNIEEDPWCLSSEAILGKVISFSRDQENRKVRGGLSGLICAECSRYYLRFYVKCTRILYPISARFLKNGSLNQFGFALTKPRAAIFRGNDNENIVLLLGKKVIGKYDAKDDKWRIRQSYRLIVDEAMLPKIDTKEEAKISVLKQEPSDSPQRADS